MFEMSNRVHNQYFINLLFYLPLIQILMFGLMPYFAGIEVPKFVDTVTPQYKAKFDSLVRTWSNC